MVIIFKGLNLYNVIYLLMCNTKSNFKYILLVLLLCNCLYCKKLCSQLKVEIALVCRYY